MFEDVFYEAATAQLDWSWSNHDVLLFDYAAHVAVFNYRKDAKWSRTQKPMQIEHQGKRWRCTFCRDVVCELTPPHTSEWQGKLNQARIEFMRHGAECREMRKYFEDEYTFSLCLKKAA